MAFYMEKMSVRDMKNAMEKTKTVIITDSDNVVLSFLTAEQLLQRFEAEKGGQEFGFGE